MEERTTLEQTFVTRKEFEAQNRLVDEKFANVITLIEKNLEIVSEKIDHAVDTLTVAINGTNDRIDSLDKRIDSLDKRIDSLDKRISDMHQTMSLWFTVLGLLAVAVPIAVAVIETFVKK